MVYKRFMRKCHTCFGHEARLYKLPIKKPPGMMSVGGASSMCEQCTGKPLRAWEKKGRAKERNVRQLMKNKNNKGTEEGDEHGVRR